MEFKEEFMYKGELYQIVLCEKDNLLSTETEECILAQNSAGEDVTFYLEGYNLKLQIAGVLSEEGDIESSLASTYSGGIILVKDFVQDYGNTTEYPCYCYKNVLEFIFEEGCLTTSIDHSKAMLRIQMNIEKGLRDIRKSKDYRCIQRFIQDSFVQDYSGSMKKRRWNRIMANFRRKHKI